MRIRPGVQVSEEEAMRQAEAVLVPEQGALRVVKTLVLTCFSDEAFRTMKRIF